VQTPQTAPPETTATTAAPPAAPRTAAELLRLSPVALDDLFRRSPAGDVPVGRGRGTGIAVPGTEVSPSLAALVSVVWRGKVFHPATQDLKNLFTPLGIPAVRAQVRREASWFDGQECIVLDYSRSSRVFGWIRDEIREVSPGLYLGLVYGLGRVFGGAKRTSVGFALDFGRPAGG
jgi:hypothetical protein